MTTLAQTDLPQPELQPETKPKPKRRGLKITAAVLFILAALLVLVAVLSPSSTTAAPVAEPTKAAAPAPTQDATEKLADAAEANSSWLFELSSRSTDVAALATAEDLAGARAESARFLAWLDTHKPVRMGLPTVDRELTGAWAEMRAGLKYAAKGQWEKATPHVNAGSGHLTRATEALAQVTP